MCSSDLPSSSPFVAPMFSMDRHGSSLFVWPTGRASVDHLEGHGFESPQISLFSEDVFSAEETDALPPSALPAEPTAQWYSKRQQKRNAKTTRDHRLLQQQVEEIKQSQGLATGGPTPTPASSSTQHNNHHASSCLQARLGHDEEHPWKRAVELELMLLKRMAKREKPNEEVEKQRAQELQ